MPKEGDLKRVELKVTVHCCDGCKKKVKKVLRATEGVLNIEIDDLEPKVTIVGNMEPQTLVKKLLKAGKQAEVLNYENQNAGNKSPTLHSSKENSTSGNNQTNQQSDTQATSNDKITDTVLIKEGEVNKASDKGTSILTDTCATPGVVKIDNSIFHRPVATCIIHPSITGNISEVTNTQYYYMVEPRPVILPAIYPCKAPATFAPVYSYSQEHYNHEGIIYQPPVQAPASVIGDYFSEENTVGCQVM